MDHCRRSRDINIEVADDIVGMVDVVIIVVGVDASIGGTKNCAICMTELQSMTFCTMRGTVRSVLRMSVSMVVRVRPSVLGPKIMWSPMLGN
jgi:hypothetical protein